MQDNIKKVSVIVPIYNGEKYIDKCVSNLLNQTYKNLEIIMLNDGSTDNSCKLLKDYCRKYSNINVVNKENTGVSDTRNLGVGLSTGDYIYFFDVDDEIEPDTIEANMNLIGEKNVDIIYFGFYYHILSEDRIVPTNISRNFEGNGHEFYNEMFRELMDKEILNSPWNKLYRRNFLIWNKIEFDANLSLYEDILFNIKALSRASHIMVNPDKYYHYMIQQTGTALTNFHDNNYESVKKIHKAGLKYAMQYSDNDDVINKYNSQFIDQVAAFIKQVVNKKDISKQKQNEIINDIIEDEYFLNVINSVDNLKKRKQFLRIFSNHKMVKALKCMYKVMFAIKKS